ncbi:MAG: hypothetical protein WAT79_04555 [Saprospiraceae bacterium]
MMNFSPQNLFISVVELFAIFIPGAIVSIVLSYYCQNYIIETIREPELLGYYFWVSFIICSYVFGHIVNRIGSVFDIILYDSWYYPKKSTYEVSEAIKYLKIPHKVGNPYAWAKYYVTSSGSPIIHRIEKNTADAKFFRSLLVISLGLGILFLIQFDFVASMIVFFLAAFSTFQYLKLRYKAALIAYEFVIYTESKR